MSDWTHDLLVVVPDNLLLEGNALALAVGTSEADIDTFRQTDFAIKIVTDDIVEQTDEEGGTIIINNKIISFSPKRFSIAHTKAVDKIIEYFGNISTAQQNDMVLTNALTNTLFVNQDFSNVDMTKIQVFFDVDPFLVLNKLNLIRVNE